MTNLHTAQQIARNTHALHADLNRQSATLARTRQALDELGQSVDRLAQAIHTLTESRDLTILLDDTDPQVSNVTESTG